MDSCLASRNCASDIGRAHFLLLTIAPDIHLASLYFALSCSPDFGRNSYSASRPLDPFLAASRTCASDIGRNRILLLAIERLTSDGHLTCFSNFSDLHRNAILLAYRIRSPGVRRTHVLLLELVGPTLEGPRSCFANLRIRH